MCSTSNLAPPDQFLEIRIPSSSVVGAKMAYATVTFLVEHISQLLNSESDQISGAEEELQLLKNDFDSLRAVLGHVANKDKEEELLMMEKEIKDVVYEAEDAIDCCLTMAATIGNKKWWHRRGLNAKPVNLAEEVRLIRENKVKPIMDRYVAKLREDEGIKPLLDLYDANVQDDVVQSGGSSGLVQPRTRLEKLRVAHHFVGDVDEQEFLIESLMEDTVELDVISIVGMGGSGRTTLARKIFNDPVIRNEFTTRIWVNISFEDDIKRKDMCVSILKQLTTRDMSRLNEFELAQKVCALLEEEKFLLVLNDVWSVEQLDVIREVLPKSNGTRKVLITSRIMSVGFYANHRRVPHTLHLLSRQESWELLQLQVFGNLLDCPPQLEQIGKSIADTCKGLPFIITLVGGSIAARLSTTSESITTVKHTWNEISESLQTYLGYKNHYLSNIMEFCYKELPDDLKYCFLYFGLFPEEYDISVWTLTRLWIAEGFIQCKDGWRLEETAENHLMQLINRNLVMVCKTNSIGTVKTCRVQKYVREFCISKVAISEQNLFQEINMSNDEILTLQVLA